MKFCAKDQCANPATHVPKLCVPAKGHPRDVARSISMVLGVECCAKHAREFPIEAALSLQVQSAVEAIAKGRADPDFKRAWIVIVATSSAEYQAYCKMTAGK